MPFLRFLLDIDPALVVFSVTHTHTGPYFGLSAMTGVKTEAESQYEDEVLDKTIEAVLDATKQWISFTDVIVRQRIGISFHHARFPHF